MKQSRTWIYHETEEPKIVYEHQAEEYYAKGWADTPAKFLKLKDHGIDPDDPIQVQQVGEAIEGVKEAANGALNLEDMSKRQLVDFAKKHFNVTLNKRDYKNSIIKEVKTLIGLNDDHSTTSN